MIREFQEYLKDRIGSQEQEQELYDDKYNSHVEIAIIKVDKIIELLEDLQRDLLKATISYSDIDNKIKYFKDLKEEIKTEDTNTKQTKST